VSRPPCVASVLARSQALAVTIAYPGEELLTPERFKQLVIETLWLGFLIIVIWMVLRAVGL
jgi:hypothetical protein